MKIVTVLHLLLLLVKFTYGSQPPWIVSSPAVIMIDAIPAAGRLLSKPVKSFFECSFSCNQNRNCLMFAFNTTGCNLYEHVYPIPKPAQVEAKGYKTYRGRNKIFKLIERNFLYNAANEACKKEFGGRLATPTNIQALSTLAEIGEQVGKKFQSCPGILLSLRSVGNNGTFKWITGETIDVVKGTGFQLWNPAVPPVNYKTRAVNVEFACHPPYGYWEEMDPNVNRYPLCEAP